jgi:uncharacterized Zn finger protein (UPF0148 family)
MALIKCLEPDCPKMLSDKAEYCPSCGHPIASELRKIWEESPEGKAARESEEKRENRRREKQEEQEKKEREAKEYREQEKKLEIFREIRDMLKGDD